MLRKINFRNIRIALLGVACFSALLSTHEAAAGECPAYDDVTAQLEKKYSEQRLFSGFVYHEDSNNVGAIYEFWANPAHGNWTLLARKLVMFQYHGRQVTRDCGFITSSGKGYNLVNLSAGSHPAEASDKPEQAGVTAPLNSSCIPHSRLASALLERYEEKPVLQALTKDSALVEIYASKDSWTITRAQLQGLKNAFTGTPLHDVKTGQEIRQICSTAVFSGQDWGFFELNEDHI